MTNMMRKAPTTMRIMPCAIWPGVGLWPGSKPFTRIHTFPVGIFGAYQRKPITMFRTTAIPSPSQFKSPNSTPAAMVSLPNDGHSPTRRVRYNIPEGARKTIPGHFALFRTSFPPVGGAPVPKLHILRRTHTVCSATSRLQSRTQDTLLWPSNDQERTAAYPVPVHHVGRQGPDQANSEARLTSCDGGKTWMEQGRLASQEASSPDLRKHWGRGIRLSAAGALHAEGVFSSNPDS